MTGVTIDRRDERLIAVKGSTAAGADRRYREAQLLARLDHPGVVQFVELVDGETVELHMQFAGSDTWENHPPTTPEAIVQGLAAVASTVADLHELGTTHRALTAEHVIVGPDELPVLCGLSDAGAADPITVDDDLAGVSGLVTHLAPLAPEPLRESLDALAGRASRGELSVAAIVAELNALNAASRSAPGLATVVDTIRKRLPRRTLAVGAAVFTVMLAAAMAWNLRTTSPTATLPLESTAATPLVDDPPAEAPPASEAPRATDRVAPADQPVDATQQVLEFVHEGRRYALGQPGDVVLLDDWNCDGAVSPALLQPKSGLVSVFLQWPEPGAAVTPDQSVVVPGASALATDTTSDCAQLRIISPDGSQLFSEDPR